MGRSWDLRGHPLGFDWVPVGDPGASLGIIGATLGYLTTALVGPQSIIEMKVYSNLAFFELPGVDSKGFLGFIGWGVRRHMNTLQHVPACI